VGNLLELVVLGTLAFVATNVDGLLVLMVFFADSEFAPIHIAAGQLVAAILWIGISVVASAAALAIPTQWLALLGVIPVGLGLGKLRAARAGSASLAVELEQMERDKRRSLRRTHSRIAAVALVALANGGDNIAVYIALFSTSTPERIAGFAALFVGLAAGWCALAYSLVHHTWLGMRIEQYGERVMPMVLIGLGLYILAKGLTG